MYQNRLLALHEHFICTCTCSINYHFTFHILLSACTCTCTCRSPQTDYAKQVHLHNCIHTNSCLMVFTVYEICTARGLYALPRAEPEEVHTARGQYYPMHCKNHKTADLYMYKANRQISFGARMSSTYCTLAVQRKVPYARHCSYSSIA